MVEGPSAKRRHVPLSKQLDRMALDIQGAKRTVYSRVATLSASQLTLLSAKDIKTILQTPSDYLPLVDRGEQLASPGTHSSITQGTSYEQFHPKAKGGATLFQQTEGAERDPFQDVATTVYDVIYRSTSPPPEKDKPCDKEEDVIDYVYDIYREEKASREEAFWEQGSAPSMPVITIVDDDHWLVVEAEDEADSNEEYSEDSNAEGYYANDYPDEEDNGSSGYDDSTSNASPSSSSSSDNGWET